MRLRGQPRSAPPGGSLPGALALPLPEAADRRCEGVADLAVRRARVSQSLFFTDGATAALTGHRDDDPGNATSPGHSEMNSDEPAPMLISG